MKIHKIGFRKYIISNNHSIKDNKRISDFLKKEFPKIRFVTIGVENGK